MCVCVCVCHMPGTATYIVLFSIWVGEYVYQKTNMSCEVLLMVHMGETTPGRAFAGLVGEYCGVRLVSRGEWDDAEKRVLIYFREIPEVLSHGETALQRGDLDVPGATTTYVCLVQNARHQCGIVLNLDREWEIAGHESHVLSGFYKDDAGGIDEEKSLKMLNRLKELVQSHYRADDDDDDDGDDDVPQEVSADYRVSDPHDDTDET